MKKPKNNHKKKSNSNNNNICTVCGDSQHNASGGQRSVGVWLTCAGGPLPIRDLHNVRSSRPLCKHHRQVTGEGRLLTIKAHVCGYVDLDNNLCTVCNKTGHHVSTYFCSVGDCTGCVICALCRTVLCAAVAIGVLVSRPAVTPSTRRING